MNYEDKKEAIKKALELAKVTTTEVFVVEDDSQDDGRPYVLTTESQLDTFFALCPVIFTTAL